jgi:hypothetical protein
MADFAARISNGAQHMAESMMDMQKGRFWKQAQNCEA